MLKITDPNLLNELPQNNRFIGTLPILDNSSIIFNGKNNILYCDEHVHLTNSILTFNGNNSVIYLCRNKHLYKLDVVTYNNSAFYVGQNNYFMENFLPFSRNRNISSLGMMDYSPLVFGCVLLILI